MKQKHEGKTAFELIEEACHLLRLAPGSALATYYLGSLPFVLALLFFWSDMSRSAFADQRLTAGAFGISLLFLWMKTWQAIFAQQLLARLCREPSSRWTLRRGLRVAVVQTILQPAGLFLLPVGLITLLPFGWIYAFYSNVTVLGGGEEANVKSVFQRAWQQSKLWPMQNHSVLFLFKIFALFVLLNLITAVFAVPFLLDTLFGVETAFSQSPLAMLNSTFFAALFGLTYLCVDPVLKAVYVLRCFYGESLRTGQDLKAELKVIFPIVRAAGVALLCLGMLGGATVAAAADTENAVQPKPATPGPKSGTGAVNPPALDHAIESVITQREYTWRMPREKTKVEHRKGTFAAFMDGILETVSGWFKGVGRLLRDFFQWLRRFFRPPSIQSGPGTDWSSVLRGLLFVLMVALVGTIVFLLVRMWQRHSERFAEETQAEAILPVPNIADENVGADQLPEDGWVRLARELLEKGELRLALRAFYLATLAHLAARNLITLAKYKSNRDYERELGRRGHALPDMLDTFSRNVSVFDRIWYGLHEVNQETINVFASNVERIKAA